MKHRFCAKFDGFYIFIVKSLTFGACLNIIILSKMQPLRYSDRPIEDVAITSLLQIDFREEEPLNSWENPLSHKVAPKRRAYSFHKTNSHSQRYNQKPHIQTPNDIKTSKTNLQFALLKQMSHQSTLVNQQQQKSSSNMLGRSVILNQGEYWSSRVNWMSDKQQKTYNSQPKLNKKFSFGYEVNGRKNSRKSGANDLDDKTRRSQYETNLIYSLLTNKQKFKNKIQSSPKLRSGALPPANIARKSGNSPSKCSQKQLKISNQLHLCMRQTLRKFYLKNHSEGFPLTVRQSQQSSIVRELLINIENIKDCQNSLDFQRVQADINSINESILNSKITQRKLHHFHHDRHILNLNQQAQKVYQGRPIHQNNPKPHSIKAL